MAFDFSPKRHKVMPRPFREHALLMEFLLVPGDGAVDLVDAKTIPPRLGLDNAHHMDGLLRTCLSRVVCWFPVPLRDRTTGRHVDTKS